MFSKKLWSLGLVLVFVFALSVLVTNGTELDLPRGLHLNWNSDEVSTTMVVTWKTTTSEAGNTVLYDTESKGGNPALYTHSAEGVAHTIEELEGYIHDVKLQGLSPGTTYYFICGGETGGYSDERKFRTVPENPEHIRFVVGGDWRKGSIDFPWGRNEISRLMVTHDPYFVINIGDFVEKAFSVSEWDDCCDHIQEAWIDTQGYTIPIIPIIGNHEVGTENEFEETKEDARFYYEYFNLPGIESWYSLSITPYLHLVALDSETYTGKNSEQYIWADIALNMAEDITWKMVGFHRPAYDPRGKGNSEYFLPLFDKYHVDIVVNGDVHLYERLQPMNPSVSKGRYFPFEEGTVHVVTGGWGAPLSTHYPLWWNACGPISTYNFTVFDVYPDVLYMKAIDVNGNVIDELAIRKELAVPETIINCTRETTYADDVTGPAPLIAFGEGEFLPIMSISRVGKGTVVAAGLAWSGVNGGWRQNEYEILFDKVFQEMVTDAEDVLWYEGYGVVYDTNECSELVSALGELGYSVVGDKTEPITTTLLEPYDILVIPQLRLGSGYEGGDPTLLPWSDVEVIKSFVEEGGGLLIMDAHDYGGNNFSRVQNKILEGLGAGMSLQSDAIYDWVENWQKGWYPLADVDPMTSIGNAYQNETGKTEIGLFEISTVVASPPIYLEKIAGGKRTIVDGRKIKTDTRVIIETKENGSGFVRILRAPSTPTEFVVVDVSTDIPSEFIEWPMTIEIYYTDDAFTDSGIKDEGLLQAYYWDHEQGMWCLCTECGVNVNRNCVSTKVYHLTKFALMPSP
jgi:hypothetical protein